MEGAETLPADRAAAEIDWKRDGAAVPHLLRAASRGNRSSGGMVRRRGIAGRAVASHRHPHREPESRVCGGARALLDGRNRAGVPAARLSLGAMGQSGRGRAAHAFRRARRGSGVAHGADLRPRRRRRGARQPVDRRPLAVAGFRGRWPLVRARHGRQQGSALDQPRRARAGARGAWETRLQCQAADRNGRGSRFAGVAADLRDARDVVARGRADRLGRSAPSLRPADDLPGLPRRVQFRSRRRVARGCASFGQLGRAPGESRHRAGQRHRLDGRRARPHPLAGLHRRRSPNRCGARSRTSSPASRTDRRSTPTGANRD